MNYDRWKTTTPDDELKPFCRCEHCDEYINYGDKYKVIRVDNINLHSDCLLDYIKDYLGVEDKYAE